jgi:hypothetical protein
MLSGDPKCAASVDTASTTTHSPIVWDIRVVKSDVPNAPPHPVFDKYFASSGSSCVHQLVDVNAFVSDTDNKFIDGSDPHKMFMFDHYPDSTPTRHDDLGDQKVKAISTASVGLLDSDEAWATLFHE